MTPTGRAISVLSWVARTLFVLLAAVMAFGFYRYPAAPIRKVDGLYVDKQDRPHSAADFERFRAWERVLIASWIGTAASAGLLRYAKRRSRG